MSVLFSSHGDIQAVTERVKADTVDTPDKDVPIDSLSKDIERLSLKVKPQSSSRLTIDQYYEMLWFRHKDTVDIEDPVKYSEISKMYYNYYKSHGRKPPLIRRKHLRQAIENWYWNRRKREWIKRTKQSKPNVDLSKSLYETRSQTSYLDRHSNWDRLWLRWRDTMDKIREIKDKDMRRRYDHYLVAKYKSLSKARNARRARGVRPVKRFRAQRRHRNIVDIRQWYWNCRRNHWISYHRKRGNLK